jgi:hypothetical protein
MKLNHVVRRFDDVWLGLTILAPLGVLFAAAFALEILAG